MLPHNSGILTKNRNKTSDVKIKSTQTRQCLTGRGEDPGVSDVKYCKPTPPVSQAK